MLRASRWSTACVPISRRPPGEELRLHSTEEDSSDSQSRLGIRRGLEKKRDELADSGTAGSSGNKAAQEFSTSLVELRDIDRELLALAVRHTNLQADCSARRRRR